MNLKYCISRRKKRIIKTNQTNLAKLRQIQNTPQIDCFAQDSDIIQTNLYKNQNTAQKTKFRHNLDTFRTPQFTDVRFCIDGRGAADKSGSAAKDSLVTNIHWQCSISADDGGGSVQFRGLPLRIRDARPQHGSATEPVEYTTFQVEWPHRAGRPTDNNSNYSVLITLKQS